MFKEARTEVPDVARMQEVTAVEAVVPTVPKTAVSRSTTSDSQPAAIDECTTEVTSEPEPERTSLPALNSAASEDVSQGHQKTKDETLQTSTSTGASNVNNEDDGEPELSR